MTASPVADNTQAASGSRASDGMVADLEALCDTIGRRLRSGLTVSRDNPGKTPQTWTVADGSGSPVLTFGMIDRTFFWTWDDGASNHYAKNRDLMVRIISFELTRGGQLAPDRG